LEGTLDNEKRATLIGRLLGFVKEFHEAHGPVPMRVLSMQFSKQSKPVGGVQALLDELRRDGSVLVLMSRTGARVVLPGGAEQSSAPQGFTITHQS
jgi:hypothetical protein